MRCGHEAASEHLSWMDSAALHFPCGTPPGLEVRFCTESLTADRFPLTCGLYYIYAIGFSSRSECLPLLSALRFRISSALPVICRANSFRPCLTLIDCLAKFFYCILRTGFLLLEHLSANLAICCYEVQRKTSRHAYG